MKVKIWTAKQLPIIQELVSNGKIPKAVADETLRVVSILDEYYGSERNVDNDDGGYRYLSAAFCLYIRIA